LSDTKEVNDGVLVGAQGIPPVEEEVTDLVLGQGISPVEDFLFLKGLKLQLRMMIMFVMGW
jgi:hypothetical protein